MNRSLEDRLREVRARVARAAAVAGRRAEDVTLVAVTKTHPVEVIEEALAAGLLHIGENKVQEARVKKPLVERGIWHLIGHLQSNKAKDAAHFFEHIDSIDSIELAREVEKRAAAEGKRLQVLLEVNVSGEGSKFGVAPGQAAAVATGLNALPHLELHGLMTLAPFVEDAEKARPVFARLRELRDRLQGETGLALPTLSMGMSHDFEIAVEEGSTEIRLGTVLFGDRPKIRRELTGEGP
jgi:PLP dependent protein